MSTIQLHAARDARVQLLRNLGFEVRIRSTQTGDYVIASLFNLVQLLRNHPEFQGKSRYDAFSQECQWRGEDGEWERLGDIHIDELRYQFEDIWGVAFTAPNMWSALNIVCRENSINPILDYFETIRGKWTPTDNKKAELLLSKYMGAEDTPINRAYSLRWLISIIARAHATVEHPVKVDTMLVMYGGQGIGKSTALQTIALDHIFGCRFFGDSELDMSKYKESVQSIQGKLIYELQELAKRTKDVEIEKAFLTRKIDDVRLPYKRVNEQIPRTTVFIRTANRKNVLTDASGSRRFWCVDLGHKKIKLPELRADIESIWAEALMWYDSGEQWWLTDEEEKLRIKAAEDFVDAHPLTEPVLEAARKMHPMPATVSKIIEQLFDAEKYLDKSTRKNQAIINDILMSNGYVYAKRQHPYHKGERLKGWWKD